MATPPFGMILSAGFGTRLAPLTEIRQKTIMELGLYPAIYYLLKMFEKCGIEDVAINLHHLPDQVIAAVEELRLDLRIHFLLEKEILGTAGAVRNAIEKLNISEQKMVIAHGDIVCDFNLSTALNSDHFCALICSIDQTIDGYEGSVHVDPDRNVVELGRYFSKNAPKVQAGFFTGVHILSEKAVELVKNSCQRCLVSQIYPSWLEEGHLIKGLMLPMYYADIGSPHRLWAANMGLFESGLNISKNASDNALGFKPGIASTAEIEHPVIIADDAIVGPGAKIGPKAVIGRGARIESGARVARSLVMSGTEVKKDENLDCVIALSRVRVGVK